MNRYFGHKFLHSKSAQSNIRYRKEIKHLVKLFEIASILEETCVFVHRQLKRLRCSILKQKCPLKSKVRKKWVKTSEE